MTPFPKNLQHPAYSDEPLAEPIAGELVPLLAGLVQHQVFFVTGSGISAPDPTRLPTGRQLAERLVESLRYRGLTALVEDVADVSDLGEVCAAIERKTNRDTLIRELLSVVEWESGAPNLCHVMLGILFGEGLLRRSFTFNWDDKVTVAMRAIDSKLTCVVDGQTLRTGTDPMFIHLHGHVHRPDQLVATEDDLTRSPLWAEPSLQASIHESEAVLVGFAAEPKYLLDSLEQFKTLAGKAPLAILSVQPLAEFTEASPTLADLCEFDSSSPKSHFIQREACEALTNLVRAHYAAEARKLVGMAAERAAHLGGSWSCPTALSRQWLEDFLLNQSLEEFLEFAWRAPALARTDPTASPFVPIALRGNAWVNVLATVLVLSSCSNVNSVEKVLDGWRFTTTSGERVDFWAVVASEDRPLTSSASSAEKSSGLFSRAADAAIPLVLLAEGGWGNPSLGHPSILARQPPDSVLTPGRHVVDALNLTTLQNRLAGTDSPPALDEVVTLGADHG